ncbi:MAG TPA: hypothetical protein VK326_05105 [Solirubrobacterales bacterium]|nr:hypothetical protein [Solirubrobacterales bacterium]
MRKLIAAAIVTAALAVPATPAFAIHDRTGMPGAVCSNPASQAVGHPATGHANTAFSNTVLAEHNHASPNCPNAIE